MHYTYLILWLRSFADSIVNNLGGVALVVKLALFRSILGGRWKMMVRTSHGIICFSYHPGPHGSCHKFKRTIGCTPNSVPTVFVVFSLGFLGITFPINTHCIIGLI